VYFEKHRATAFSYIDSGAALGMYRDGGMVPDDSDIDVRWGSTHPMQLPKGLDPLLSMNRRVFRPQYVADVASIWKDLCTRPVIPNGEIYFVHKAQMQLKATTRRYGSHWFVRMPFKGYSSIHSFIGKPDWWRRSLAVVRRMDADHDGVISVNEVDAWVKSDGIWVVEYNRQISARQRCEAAAALTFLLQYDERPTRVPKDNVLYRGYYHPLVQEAITRACGPAVQQVHG